MYADDAVLAWDPICSCILVIFCSVHLCLEERETRMGSAQGKCTSVISLEHHAFALLKVSQNKIGQPQAQPGLR